MPAYLLLLYILRYFLLIAFVAILGYIAYIMLSFRDIVPYVPTPRRIIKKMIALADIKNNEKVCDLGSGSGKIVIAAAQKHKKNLVWGFEKSWLLRLATKLKLSLHPFLKKRVLIANKDFFNLDLRDFNVIFCFLTPAAMRLLAPQFQLLKKGSRLISYMFPLESSLNFQEFAECVRGKNCIYLYLKSD